MMLFLLSMSTVCGYSEMVSINTRSCDAENTIEIFHHHDSDALICIDYSLCKKGTAMSLTKVSMTASRLKSVLNWWPPYSLGPGIRVSAISDDFRSATVQMPLRFYNRNYIGTHFGGSLYSMCDPMYMLLLLNILGPEFIVWDKAARIEYRKPGRGTVTAEFRVEDAVVDSLRALQPNEKKFIDLDVDVTDEDGDVVARVVKTLYARRKGETASPTASDSEMRSKI